MWRCLPLTARWLLYLCFLLHHASEDDLESLLLVCDALGNQDGLHLGNLLLDRFSGLLLLILQLVLVDPGLAQELLALFLVRDSIGVHVGGPAGLERRKVVSVLRACHDAIDVPDVPLVLIDAELVFFGLVWVHEATELLLQSLNRLLFEGPIGDQHLMHCPVAEQLRNECVFVRDSVRESYLLLGPTMDEADLRQALKHPLARLTVRIQPQHVLQKLRLVAEASSLWLL